jgi:catechol 2,3-dioxygenase-like lactoylglutathione lyase family enzyme
MATRFTHITFAVLSFERSITFYREVCGLVVIRDRRPTGGKTVWLGPATAAGAEAPYVLVLHEGAVREPLDHLGFQCDTRDEVDAKAALGVRLGVVASGPEDLGGVLGYAVLLHDPDGHGVEFTHGQPIAGVA